MCGSVCGSVCVCVCVCVTLKPQKPVKLGRVPGAVLTHARSYLKVLSGIPEGSIDSIGDPLGLDRSIDRLESIDRGSPRALLVACVLWGVAVIESLLVGLGEERGSGC